MIEDLLIKLKNSNLFKDSFWALIGSVLNKGFGLLSGIAIARMLGSSEYGEYGMIKNTLVYIAVFSTFGLGFTVTKFLSQISDDNHDKIIATIKSANRISILFSSIMAAGVLIFAQPLATFLDAPNMVQTVRLTAFAIIFNSLTTVQIGILAGLKQFKAMAKINSIIGVITFITSVVFTYFWGLNGAVTALLFSNIINCVMNKGLIRHKIKGLNTHKQSWYWSETLNMLKFSFPIAIQESSYSITYWLGALVLIKLSDYSQMGLYAAANQWSAVILFIPSVLQNVFLSYLSGGEYKETLGHKKLLRKMLLANFVITFIPFLFIMALSPFITRLYGETYYGLSYVLHITIGTTIISCLIKVYVQDYISLGRTWALCFIRLVRDLLGLILSWLLISSFTENAAIWYSLSYATASLICLLLMAKYHKYPEVSCS